MRAVAAIGVFMHARRVEIMRLKDATHLAFLDRPQHGRAQLVEAVIRFLATD